MRYFSSFFDKSTALTNPEETILNICVADYLAAQNDEESLYFYLASRQFLKDGYTKVFFNCFDFTKNAVFTPLLEIVSDAFIFVQAEFTFQQVNGLLRRDYDLSRCSYRIKNPVTLDEYLPLYEFCFQNKILNRLHDLPVDLSDTDLRSCPDNFASICFPQSLHNATLSQGQFDHLLSQKRKTLNLSGIILDNINIGLLIKNHGRLIAFDQTSLKNASSCICLEKTTLNNSIVDVETLSLFSMSPKYLYWFQSENVKFIIRRENGILVDDYVVSIKTIFEKIDSKIIQKLSCEIESINPLIKNLNVNTLSRTEIFLWFSYCAHHKPNSFLENAYWNVIKATHEPAFTNHLTA